MKRLLILASVCVCAFGQGVPDVSHLDRSALINLHPELTDLGTGAAYTTFPFLRLDPIVVGGQLSGVSLPVTAAVTGSNAYQSIEISSTDGISVGDWLVIDGGLSTQEMTNIVGVPDATHVTAVFLASHASGARVRKVFTSFTKYVDAKIASLPVGGINNITFVRQTNLPPNVYDQYRVIAQAGTACGSSPDSSTPDVFWTSNFGGIATIPPVPQYSSGSLTLTGNPSNGVDLGSSGPYTTAPVEFCVQVSLMFTATPEPSTRGLDYRFYWDF